MIKYLSIKEVAELLGISVNSAKVYKLPPPDAVIGDRRGWLPQTIIDWNERRPGTRTTAENANWYLPPEVRV